MIGQNWFAWSRTLAAIGLIVTTLEYLAALSLFGEDGILSWRIFVTHSRPLRFQFLENWRKAFFRPSIVAALSVLRLLSVLALLIPHQSQGAYLIYLAIAFVTGCLISYRCMFGGDGSDQMHTIVLAGLIVYCLLGTTQAGEWQNIGIWFIALQSCLSYLSAGVSKLVSKKWRDGSAAFLIFNTCSYGTQGLANVLRDSHTNRLLMCWGVIVFECLFPLCLIAPEPVLLTFLACGVFFHLCNAVFMGLNTFLWAFAATYPAIIYCHNQLGQWLR